MNTNLTTYYNDRAREYETIYAKPERQPDLQRATQLLHQIFRGKDVFEIACGTGYWTERIAQTAAQIVATDINDSVLEIARSKLFAPTTVTFAIADVYQLPNKNLHESLFGGFIWSHIPVQELNRFLESVSKCVLPGGTIVFIDNSYIAGSNLPITRTDAAGNTYQTRRLANGAVYEVLKNFPTPDFLVEYLREIATDINLISLTYFWLVTCKKR